MEGKAGVMSLKWRLGVCWRLRRAPMKTVRKQMPNLSICKVRKAGKAGMVGYGEKQDQGIAPSYYY